MASNEFVVLGAGVIGLSTALALREVYPTSQITLLARHFPGDYHIDYASPWASGNWCSSANDNGILEKCDRITFHRFARLAAEVPEAGIDRSELRMIFDQKVEDAGILGEGTGRIWYDELAGGLVPLTGSELPSGSVFGYDVPSTFVINTQVYLQWLLKQCRLKNIGLIRKSLNHIHEARLSPNVQAVFNCTGLGSYSLAGVNDNTMYPTRGQTVLVSQPIQPLKRMYFRSPQRVDNDTTYVFQRPLGGGIVLGGCREDNKWDEKPDPEFAQDIIRRCCALAPELGPPDGLTILGHGVGLRPNRKGGPRMEIQRPANGDAVIIHNYGASGAGYQASWGMATYGVSLFQDYMGGHKEKPKL